MAALSGAQGHTYPNPPTMLGIPTHRCERFSSARKCRLVLLFELEAANQSQRIMLGGKLRPFTHVTWAATTLFQGPSRTYRLQGLLQHCEKCDTGYGLDSGPQSGFLTRMHTKVYVVRATNSSFMVNRPSVMPT